MTTLDSLTQKLADLKADLAAAKTKKDRTMLQRRIANVEAALALEAKVTK